MLPYLLLAFCAQEAPSAIPDPHAVGRGNPALVEVELGFSPEKILFDPDRVLPWIPSS